MAAARGEGSQRGDWGGDGYVMITTDEVACEEMTVMSWATE